MSLINVGSKSLTYNGDLVECVAENKNKNNVFTQLCLVTPKGNLCSGKNKPKIVRYYSLSGVSEFGNAYGNLIKKVIPPEAIDKAIGILF